MSKTISFVASDKLAEWLEEESERRMTTISSTAQQLLAEKYRQDEASGGSGEREAEQGETPEIDGLVVDDDNVFHFSLREQAQAFRDSISDEWLAEEDDARRKEVHVEPDAPESVVREAAIWAGERVDSNETSE
ncbi:MAG: hypothetical protein ABEI52_00920 [Halobacteriaceae archaeon]